MKVSSNHAAVHAKAATHTKKAAPAGITAAQVKALGKEINNRLQNSDVGIDQSQTAGSDITNQDAPRGTAPKAAALYEKWLSQYDPRTAQQEGVALYSFNLQDISSKQPNTPVWGVMKYDENSGVMVLFDRKGEIGKGKLNDDNQTYTWSAAKSAS
jgi:hypothetical protein